MRRWLSLAAAGALAALALPGPAAGDEKPAAEVCTEEGCGKFGTSVAFVATPSEAAKQALKEEKLVLVLHVSGLFENPEFTWNNAEALRVNALADPKVGEFINKHFVSSFQKVATFRIVGKQKQGGNVASYFCAPDGRVLHVVAGPVDAATMLREAKWVVDTAFRAMDEARGDGAKFKAVLRKAHAQKLRDESGLVVEPVTYDPPVEQDPTSALTYRDPTGRPLAPKLPPVPINGPDVKFRFAQAAEVNAAGARALEDRLGRRWVLGNQGRVHQLMAAHALVKIENVYGAIFEGILGEQISTRPVEVLDPFPWHARNLQREGVRPRSGLAPATR